MIAYNRVDGDEGWRQDVDSLEETLGTLGIEERVCNTNTMSTSSFVSVVIHATWDNFITI